MATADRASDAETASGRPGCGAAWPATTGAAGSGRSPNGSWLGSGAAETTTGTATALAGSCGGPKGTRVRIGAIQPGDPMGESVSGLAAASEPARPPASSPARLSGPVVRPDAADERVVDRRGAIAFGAIVIRTSRRGPGRDRATAKNAAPSAPPRTTPKTRNAISDELTVLPCRPRVGSAIGPERSCEPSARQPHDPVQPRVAGRRSHSTAQRRPGARARTWRCRGPAQTAPEGPVRLASWPNGAADPRSDPVSRPLGPHSAMQPRLGLATFPPVGEYPSIVFRCPAVPTRRGLSPS